MPEYPLYNSTQFTFFTEEECLCSWWVYWHKTIAERRKLNEFGAVSENCTQHLPRHLQFSREKSKRFTKNCLNVRKRLCHLYTSACFLWQLCKVSFDWKSELYLHIYWQYPRTCTLQSRHGSAFVDIWQKVCSRLELTFFSAVPLQRWTTQRARCFTQASRWGGKTHLGGHFKRTEFFLEKPVLMFIKHDSYLCPRRLSHNGRDIFANRRVDFEKPFLPLTNNTTRN